jgi:hypothetical protein
LDVVDYCELQASDDTSETVVDFKAKNTGDAPPIPGPQSTGHYDPVESIGDTVMQHGKVQESHQLPP